MTHTLDHAVGVSSTLCLVRAVNSTRTATPENSNQSSERGISMCPVCVTTMAFIVASATSTGGLGALVAKKLSAKNNAHKSSQPNSTENQQ